MEPMAYEAEHGNMASAQSAVAFNCLEQLLNDKIVKTIVWTYRQMQNKTQKKKNFEHTKKHPNKFPAGSKPMMMPVMMGPNGQMMIMATPEMMKNAAMQGNMNRKTNKNKQTKANKNGRVHVAGAMHDNGGVVRPAGQGQTQAAKRKRRLREEKAAAEAAAANGESAEKSQKVE
jgi:hypothetical protein